MNRWRKPNQGGSDLPPVLQALWMCMNATDGDVELAANRLTELMKAKAKLTSRTSVINGLVLMRTDIARIDAMIRLAIQELENGEEMQ